MNYFIFKWFMVIVYVLSLFQHVRMYRILQSPTKHAEVVENVRKLKPNHYVRLGVIQLLVLIWLLFTL